MNDKPNEQIVNEIKVHFSNAVKLLRISQEIEMSAMNLENLEKAIAEMERAVEFQKFSINEMKTAAYLQNILLQRQLENILRQKQQIGLT